MSWRVTAELLKKRPMHKKRFRKPAWYRENFITKLAFATDGLCFSGVTVHHVTCLKEAFRKCFKKAATHKQQQSEPERAVNLLLLASCTGGNGVPSVVRSNLPWKVASKLVTWARFKKKQGNSNALRFASTKRFFQTNSTTWSDHKKCLSFVPSIQHPTWTISCKSKDCHNNVITTMYIAYIE